MKLKYLDEQRAENQNKMQENLRQSKIRKTRAFRRRNRKV